MRSFFYVYKRYSSYYINETSISFGVFHGELSISFEKKEWV
jgi:hypothetical protein